MQTRYPGACQCGARVPAGTNVTLVQKQITECPSCTPSLAPSAGHGVVALQVALQRLRTPKPGWTIADVILDGPAPTEGVPVSPGYPFSAVGKFPDDACVGDVFIVSGRFDQHARWGLQFKVSAASRVVGGTVASLRTFLKKLSEVGSVRADAIIQHFRERDAILAALDDVEALMTVPSVGRGTAEKIVESYRASAELRDATLWLAERNVGEAVAAKALDMWEAEVSIVLTADPYTLMELPQVGFRTADEIALRSFGIDRLDPRRAAAAVLYLLQEEERDGHTWTPLVEFQGHAPIAGI